MGRCDLSVLLPLLLIYDRARWHLLGGRLAGSVALERIDCVAILIVQSPALYARLDALLLVPAVEADPRVQRTEPLNHIEVPFRGEVSQAG